MRPDAAAVARALLAAPRAAAPAVGAGAAFRRPGGAGGAAPRGIGGAGAGAAPSPRPPGVHDPAAPGAVVLNAAQWTGGAGLDATGRPVAPVVLDPYLRRSMRPHQVEGVRFLYETTMGVAAPGRLGCILAGACGWVWF
jgi:DNA repair and recombination protein RAD54B